MNSNNWKPCNTQTGSVASGQHYQRRPKIERKLLREIERGSHILFTAPRRIGKSSIMRFLAEQHQSNRLCIYENISSDRNTRDFYKRLFHLALRAVYTRDAAWSKLKSFLKRYQIEGIGLSSIKFKSAEPDYKEAFFDLLPDLSKAQIKLVLFLDEFPDVIKNIAGHEGKKEALDILQTLRSLRHHSEFSSCLSLVLAGSIGLDHVVKDIDRTAVINDFHFEYLHALEQEEALALIDHITQGATMELSTEVRDYLLRKIRYPMPYYLQLLLKACDDLLWDEQRPTLQPADVDRAWEQLLSESKFFSDWDERLEDYFPDYYPFFLDLLSQVAHHGQISLQEIYALAEQHSTDDRPVTRHYKGLLDDVLIKDGYLLKDSNGSYCFQSPLLQDWWRERHPSISSQTAL